jgi:hypothetical protein
MFSNTTSTLIALQPESDGYFSLFFENYEVDQDLELSSNSFKLVVHHMLHLLTSGGMVLEHVRKLFSPRKFNKWIP